MEKTKIYELVEMGKKERESDNAYAVRLGLQRGHINNWKSGISSPSAENYLLLCQAAGLTTLEQAMEYLRQSEKQRKQAGFIDLNVLSGMLGMSLAAVGGVTYSPALSGFALVAGGAIYIMRS